MKHLDEGTVQAFLDDELPPAERAAAAEHIMACAECRAEHETLKRANATFGRAMAELDADALSAQPAPPAPPPAAAHRRKVAGAASFVRAAGLVLLLAAAASAAVPGSPVREWIESAVAPEEAAPTPAPVVTEAPPRTPPAAPAPAAPAGVSIVPSGSMVDVVLVGVADAVLRLRLGNTEMLAVSATGGTEDPLFRTAAGRVEVRGGQGGVVLIELPNDLAAARVVVDGRVYAEKAGRELRVLVPAAETGEAGIVWR